MARVSKSKSKSKSNRSRAKSPAKLRVPREMRIVSRNHDQPMIKLSGEWLKRLGFPPGARFLVLADDSKQILLARV